MLTILQILGSITIVSFSFGIVCAIFEYKKKKSVNKKQLFTFEERREIIYKSIIENIDIDTLSKYGHLVIDNYGALKWKPNDSEESVKWLNYNVRGFFMRQYNEVLTLDVRLININDLPSLFRDGK